MKIYPAIDLYGGKAVRLLRGNYAQMTVYNDNPLSVAKDFVAAGATHIHVVDLEGAKFGTTPNIGVVESICRETPLFLEIGGGIRSLDVIEKYVAAGVGRVILGTAAVTDSEFLKAALEKYGEKIAVGIDLAEGNVAIKGWTERTAITADEFFSSMQALGVRTVICTDISKDGAMQGTNRELYKELSQKYAMNIIASGGVSTIEDIRALREMQLHGAIIGKAYYLGAIDLKEAIEVAK